ncbi:hypothetical protein KAR52_02800 [Candidatus Pacearchaeota archaeon]|nr:hypothetical protein [Candidatus Pacearchaeota archaeon]
MVKLELYKVAQKGDLPDVLVPDRDCLDSGMRLSWGDVICKKALSKALSAAERNEGLEVLLQVGSQEEIDSILEKTTKQDSNIGKVNESPKVQTYINERIRDALQDTVGKQDAINSQTAGGYLNYIINAMNSSKGFRGMVHRFFPVLFILHQLPGFQPMVWSMMLVDPKNYENCKRDLAEHYYATERGVAMMYNNVKITPTLNRYSLGVVNKIIKEDKEGEGYNNAFRMSSKLTLPQAVIDHLHIATQSTEHTQWGVYQKVPVNFVTLPLEDLTQK